MPVKYTISDRGCFVELVATGKVTGAELIQQKLALAKEPGLTPGYAELCDFASVASLEIEPDFFEKIAEATEENQRAHRNSRTAIVVSRADFFDLARRYERIVTRLGMTVIVFNHRDTAMLWLGRRVPERGRDAGIHPEAGRSARNDRPVTDKGGPDKNGPDKSGSSSVRGGNGGKPDRPGGGDGPWGRG